jgi:hypothetical protein
MTDDKSLLEDAAATPPADPKDAAKPNDPPTPEPKDEKALDPKDPAADPKDTKADGPDDKKPEDAKPAGAPEAYSDPKLPDNVKFDDELKKEVSEFAKSQNLPQEEYQKMVDLGVKLIDKTEKANAEMFEQIKKQDAEETKKALGADYQRELAAAMKAIDTVLADPAEKKEFLERMTQSGFANWLPMIKVLNYYGKLVSEDKTVGTKPAGTVDSRSLAERLHPELVKS